MSDIERIEADFTKEFFVEQAQCTGGYKDFSGKKEINLPKLSHFERLDSFAILFGYCTSCVAVSLVGDRLVVAINKNTRDYEKFCSIVESTMEFFSLLCIAETITEAKRRQLFEDLCTAERIAFEHPEAQDPAHIQEAINIVFGYNKREEEIAEFVRRPECATVYGIVSNLYINFKKIESFIKKGISRQNNHKEKILFKTLEKGISTVEILRLPKDEFHAEMQIVRYVLEGIQKKNIRMNNGNNCYYIGLSKLCCLKCNAALSVINRLLNDVSKSEKIIFLTRGWHNILYDKWIFPLYEKENICGVNSDVYFEQYMDKKERITRASCVCMTADATSSESSIAEFDVIKVDQLKKMGQIEDFFSKSLCLKNKDDLTREIVNHIEFTKCLFKNDDFINYCRNYIEEQEDIENIKRDFLLIIENLYKEISVEKRFIMGTLQDPAFVGDKIAEHFRQNAKIFTSIIEEFQKGICSPYSAKSRSPIIHAYSQTSSAEPSLIDAATQTTDIQAVQLSPLSSQSYQQEDFER